MASRATTATRLTWALLGLAAAASLAHALWVSAVNDDTGIALAYARTFASGDGLRLTSLSPRVEGYSDPLWVLWLSVAYLLRLDAARFARVSGALFAAIAVVIVGLAPSRRNRRPLRPLDAVPAWILALDTTYSYWAGAGLETGAFALASSVAMVWGSAWPAGALAVLRPEGVLHAAALAPWRKGSLVRWLALASAPLVVWLVLRRVYYREWLPNTYYAKRDWDYGGLAYLTSWFEADAWHFALLASPLVLAMRPARRVAAPALAVCAAAASFVLLSRGDWMPEHRFVAHALPAAALLAGLTPTLLGRVRGASALYGIALVASVAWGSRSHSAVRKQNPVVPLTYVAAQARVFRGEADRVGFVHPRIAHFDVGGLALESGGEVIDLAGLADSYIGRVGYHSEKRVRDYVFDEVEPDMINVHGPCAYLRDDPRLVERYYLFAASSQWGENWVRKDDACPPDAPSLDELRRMRPRTARSRWLCARARLPHGGLPDVRSLALSLQGEGLRRSDRELLAAAVALDPSLVRAAHRLLELQLER